MLADVFDPSMLLPETTRRLKRSEYDRLVRLDAFEDERVELLHGTVVKMSPNRPEHASPIERLSHILVPALNGRGIVRVQLSFLAADESEPEPDVAVVPLGDHSREHPSSAHLVIEVAASSLRKDRLVKAPLYAASGVREYWIVNVPERCVELFRNSDGQRYQATSQHASSETVSLIAFPDVRVAIADVFGQ